MAAAGILGCGGFVFALVIVLSGREVASGRRRAARAAARPLELAARSRAVAALAGWAPWARLCDAWAPRLSAALHTSLDRRRSCVALLGLIALAGALGAVAAGSWVGLVAGVALAVALVALRAARDARSRSEELARAMPAAFRSLAASLAAGRTLAQALAYVGAHGHRATRGAFSRSALRMSCGYSSQEALDGLVGELEAPGSELLACALSVSHRTGSPLMGLFERAARMIEGRQALAQELSVKTAQVRLSVRVVCVVPLLLVCALALLSPDYRAGLATPAGMASVAVAALLDALALLIIRRLVRGVL